MRNAFLAMELVNMKIAANAFRQRCQAAALKDDGRIDDEEARILKKIDAATDKFLKELAKIK